MGAPEPTRPRTPAVNLGRRATRLVWMLAGLGLSGCFACLAFLVVAFNRVESIAEERSRLASQAQSLVDLFGRYCNAVGEHLHHHLDPAAEPPDDHTAMESMPEVLRRHVANTERQSGSKMLGAILGDFDRQFRELETLAAGWHRGNAATEARTKARLDEAFAAINEIRGTLSTLEGRIRLRRIREIRDYHLASGEEASRRAAELLRPVADTQTLASAETELSDIALFAQKLSSEILADRIADLRENSIKPAVARLHQAVDRIHGLPGDSDEVEIITADLIALRENLIGRSGAESLAALAESRSASSALRVDLTRRVEQFIADMHLSGEKILAYVAEQHAIADQRVARSIDASRAGCAILLAALALATLALGKRVSKDLRDQATALQDSNSKLDDALEEANAANRAKTDFLANMSHEIRTPMTAILGFADLLAEPDTPPKERDQHVEIIRRQGEHLLSIINDILDLAKIDLGRLTVESLPTMPLAVASEAISLLGPTARVKGLTLHLDAHGPEAPDILTDPLRLRQILINLVGNAIKFTQAGEVRLDTAWNPAENTLRFHVRDSGMGLSPEQIARLFKPFSQADETMSRRFGGTGIGLSLSQRLAARLGGEISVTSTPGVGSVFTLTLRPTLSPTPAPRPAPPQQHQPLAAPPAPAKPLAGLHILFAEDGPENQRLINHHLTKAGAEVTLAENGRIAVDLARARAEKGAPFNLILMDMQMPELDGYAATSMLRDDHYPCPIIALTAHAMSGDRERCLAAGCIEHLTKPIDRAKLLTTCAAFAIRPIHA